MSAEVQVLEDFVPHVGEDFVLPGDESGEHPPIAFTLLSATELKHGFPDQKRPPFQLIFRVASKVVFDQGMYQLTHPATGERLVFLVPSGQSAEGIEYCATFN